MLASDCLLASESEIVLISYVAFDDDDFESESCFSCCLLDDVDGLFVLMLMTLMLLLLRYFHNLLLFCLVSLAYDEYVLRHFVGLETSLEKA